MNEAPFFSIIIPVYNTEAYLSKCVGSVLEQTFKDYEIILVDDGSPDNCPRLCDEYEEKNKCIKTVHKKNGGLSEARNTGIKIATGKYVMFLDSDDFWCDIDCLKKIKNKLSDKNTDILIFGKKKFYPNKNYYSREMIMCSTEDLSAKQTVQCLMEKNIFVACAWDKVISRELIEEKGLYFVPGQVGEDIEWCIKILLCAPKIDIINECFYAYRQQNVNSITANIGRKNLEQICFVIEKYAAKDNPDVNHFLAVQYVQWLSISARVIKSEIKDLLLRMKKYWYLLDFDRYPYVKKVNKVKFIGYENVRLLLGMYRKLKRRWIR